MYDKSQIQFYNYKKYGHYAYDIKMSLSIWKDKPMMLTREIKKKLSYC